ncbi:MAG: hypothetical protein PHX51_00500 [Clostridia bacterium]|nr:hypothetical protein [Clostridia bacterium]
MYFLTLGGKLGGLVCEISDAALFAYFFEQAKQFYSQFGWSVVAIAIGVCVLTSVVKPFYKKVINRLYNKAVAELNYYSQYMEQLGDMNVESYTEEELSAYSDEYATAGAALNKLTLRSTAKWVSDTKSFVSLLTVIFWSVAATCVFFCFNTGNFGFLLNSGYYTYVLGVVGLSKLIYGVYEKVGLQDLLSKLVKAVFKIKDDKEG